MKSQSLLHDTAWATAISVVEVFAPLLMEAEKHDAVEEVYDRVKAGLVYFEIQQRRMEQRIRPTNN